MKNVKRTALLVGALGLISAPVLAGQARSRLDANGDSKISLQEMQAQAEKRFQAADSNHDGQLSQSERSQRQGCRGHHRQQGKQGQAQHQGFKGPDTDGNGALSQAESQAAVQKRFERLDTNHDGVISQDEIQARRSQRHQMRGQMRGQTQGQTQSQTERPKTRQHRDMI